MRQLEARTLERGNIVLDVMTGDLLEFLWMSGYDRDRNQPYHVQLRPFLDRTDYSLGLAYSEILSWRYVRLV